MIISHDVVGERMAGPGIRYYHLARVLSQEFEVILAVPGKPSAGVLADFPVESYTSGGDESLEEWIRGARTVVLPAILAPSIPVLRENRVALVIDGYDPYVAETLHLGGDVLTLQHALASSCLMGDFFLCASERQRDWWLGLLEANGRVNPYTFSEDPSLRQLIDVVPFGMPESPPCASRPVIKGVWSGIDAMDKVILWGGGLWPWLDPLTAIRAIARVYRVRRDVRLIFPGTSHPNPWMKGIPTHNEAALRLAEELNLLGKAVFFGDWIPYADWPAVLLESDVALTLHYDTLEARLAFRSRVLDYIWAGLLIVATRGDATSDLVEKYQLGIVVNYEDEIGIAEAILKLLEMPKGAYEQCFLRARKELTWEKVAQPLIEFCRHPRRAPDKEILGERLGNPYYVERIAHLQSTIEGYEQGRFIRLMRWLHRAGRSLRGGLR